MTILPPVASRSSLTIAADDGISQEVKYSRPTRWITTFHPRLDEAVCGYNYTGDGTETSPYLVEFLPNDSEDALTFSTGRKWTITGLQAMATLAVTFASSAYSGCMSQVIATFNAAEEVATLGVSLFVLGFAVGPLIWAPLSELYGRQIIFVITFTALVAFSVGATCAQTMPGLLVLRFFASAFGSSSLTNAGGVIADMFTKSERGLAMGVFAMAPFLGPAFGPIVGGFLGETEGWRWLHGLIAIFSGVLWIAITILVPETYAPFILRRRAQMLSKKTGEKYISTLDAGESPKSLPRQIKISLTRPLVLLFKEPIVLLTSVYIAIIYGTLYLFFGAFPIIFQGVRGWNAGIGGLPFIGVAIGVVLATASAAIDNKRYMRLASIKGNEIEPEARLPLSIIGSFFLPAGLFLFAWTTYPSVHWIVPIIGGMLFACGLVMVFLSLSNYLIDSYVVFAASVLAANSLLRSLFGFAFPLFTRQMYDNLGNQWASCVPAFLALACVPCPFLFYKYGHQIRMKCKYASEAVKVLEKMRAQQVVVTVNESDMDVEEVCRA